MKGMRWNLHRIDYSCISKPSLPRLRHIISEDPRIKIYFPYVESNFIGNTSTSTRPEIEEKQWHLLKEEESLFYQQINEATAQKKNNDTNITRFENGIASPEIDRTCDDIINSYNKDTIDSLSDYMIKEQQETLKTSRDKLKMLLNHSSTEVVENPFLSSIVENPFLANTVENPFLASSVENPFLSDTSIIYSKPESFYQARDSIKEAPDSPTENEHDKYNKFRNHHEDVKSLLLSIDVPSTLTKEIDAMRRPGRTQNSFSGPSISSSLSEKNLFNRETSFERIIQEKIKSVESGSKLSRKRHRISISKSPSPNRFISRGKSPRPRVYRKHIKSLPRSRSRSHSPVRRKTEINNRKSRSKSPYSGLENRWRSSPRRIKTEYCKTSFRNRSPLSPRRNYGRSVLRRSRSKSSSPLQRNNKIRYKSKSPVSPCRNYNKSKARSGNRSSLSPRRNYSRSKLRRSRSKSSSPLQRNTKIRSKSKSPLSPFRNENQSKLWSSGNKSPSRKSNEILSKSRSDLSTIKNYLPPDKAEAKLIATTSISTNNVQQASKQNPLSTTTITTTISTNNNQETKQLNLTNTFQTNQDISSNNLSKSQRSHQDIVCEVCNIFVNTEAQYIEHLNGKKHNKKAQLLQILQEENGQVQNLKKLWPQPTPLANLKCDVCKKYTFTSIDAYDSHMMSMKHTKNLTATLNQISEDKIVFREKKNANDTFVKSFQNYSEQVFENEKFEIKKKGVFIKHCPLCNIIVNSEDQYEKHLVSKGHLKKLK